MKIGLLLTPDNRSKAYIQKIFNQNISLDEIIFMNDKRDSPKFSEQIILQSKKNGFDISEKVESTLLNHNLKFKEFPFIDINNKDLINYIKEKNLDYIIFSGGGILKKEILSCRTKFIHFHPGIASDYKGSTCFYYSILDKNNCGVSAIIMDEGLDTGDIVYQRIFSKPEHFFVDEVYDPYIRSETLMDILKKNILEKNEFKKQKPSEGNTYYIIHPVLKHIALLCCQKK